MLELVEEERGDVRVKGKAKSIEEDWGLAGLNVESDISLKAVTGSLEALCSVINTLSK